MLAFQLFFEFCKTGLFAVGGGLATLPFLYRMAEATNWFTASDIADLVAISESTPGPLGVNMATYVGFKSLGLFGGIISTLGLIFPSIIVILIISQILDHFKNAPAVQRIFYGLRPASTALISAAGLGVARIALLHTDRYQDTGILTDLFNWKCIIMAIVIYVVIKLLSMKKINPHPILFIALSAIAGILLQL